ncbi:AbrB/MazE/SpoVT family DNA-binding domain-containing protein [Pararhizobium arenae]|uniref:AbrB/MazE/SpoVT family DNA-binding domain-containing protein n=1 Tax=Pararhizobium arenae TaxID=1856850 RepID=UPI00094B2AAE|nr:AbrB/MazE/SpoVT family DNA-binding domain-containing protein [Pararhizobium arenae]
MFWELTLSSKGQVTIPKEMREALNLRPGDQLIYSFIDGEVVVTPKNLDFNELAGLLGTPPGGRASIDEIDGSVLNAGGTNVIDTDDDVHSDAAA